MTREQIAKATNSRLQKRYDLLEYTDAPETFVGERQVIGYKIAAKLYEAEQKKGELARLRAERVSHVLTRPRDNPHISHLKATELAEYYRELGGDPQSVIAKRGKRSVREALLDAIFTKLAPAQSNPRRGAKRAGQLQAMGFEIWNATPRMIHREGLADDDGPVKPGWYFSFPGSDVYGPYATKAAAMVDVREGVPPLGNPKRRRTARRNPPAETMSREVLSIKYVHSDDKAAYVHKFAPGVVMVAPDDYTIVLKRRDGKTMSERLPI